MPLKPYLVSRSSISIGNLPVEEDAIRGFQSVPVGKCSIDYHGVHLPIATSDDLQTIELILGDADGRVELVTIPVLADSSLSDIDESVGRLSIHASEQNTVFVIGSINEDQCTLSLVWLPEEPVVFELPPPLEDYLSLP